MSVMPDHWIKSMAEEKKMIEPFVDKQIRDGISFGLSSYGYDFRISNEFKVFDPAQGTGIIDPKAWDHLNFKDVIADVCEIPPNGYVLARTVEYFCIPRDIITICFGKSTYARCGVTINVTPFEPEWEGYATIAISNSTPRPAKIYANEGIGQIIFLRAEDECMISYSDKKGKYQSQKEITVAKI